MAASNDVMNPKNYGPGKSGPQNAWLIWRLMVHGHIKPDAWDEELQAYVADMQRAQGWTGEDADGLPGRETLRRLAADPKGGARTYHIDTDGWKVQTPDGKDHDPANYFHPQWFHFREDGALVFAAPVKGGKTTPNTTYLRSELRELLGHGHDDEWDSGDGRTHTLTMLAAFTHLPPVKRHAVGAQVHDDTDDVVMIRCEGHDDGSDRASIFMEVSNGKGNGSELVLLDDGYRLGEKYRVQIIADRKGFRVIYELEDGSHKVEKGFGGRKRKCYFKAGMYVQAKAGQKHNGKTVPDTGYGEAVIFELDVTHQ